MEFIEIESNTFHFSLDEVPIIGSKKRMTFHVHKTLPVRGYSVRASAGNVLLVNFSYLVPHFGGVGVTK